MAAAAARRPQNCKDALRDNNFEPLGIPCQWCRLQHRLGVQFIMTQRSTHQSPIPRGRPIRVGLGDRSAGPKRELDSEARQLPCGPLQAARPRVPAAGGACGPDLTPTPVSGRIRPRPAGVAGRAHGLGGLGVGPSLDRGLARSARVVPQHHPPW